MKTRLMSAIVLITLLGGTAPAFAQGGTPSPNATPKRESIQSWIKDRFQRNAERRERVRTRLAVDRIARIREWWNRTLRRLNALIGRLEHIADLIQKRIDRLQAAGSDTTAAQEQLDEAKRLIADAKTDIAAAADEVERILAADVEPAEIFRELHALHREILDSIRDAHRALIKALTLVRRLTATPTASPTS